jgi:hypothetical protein
MRRLRSSAPPLMRVLCSCAPVRRGVKHLLTPRCWRAAHPCADSADPAPARRLLAPLEGGASSLSYRAAHLHFAPAAPPRRGDFLSARISAHRAHISAHLRISPHISAYLRISPHISAHLRTSPHISAYLRTSPARIRGRYPATTSSPTEHRRPPPPPPLPAAAAAARGRRSSAGTAPRQPMAARLPRAGS